MIRFSAGLVVVAIGVLIAGATTSKLLLVYVAIAVSVAALLALAIGVALKREEIFADARQPATAAAGQGNGQPADVDAGQLQPAGQPRAAGQPRPWPAESGAPWDTARLVGDRTAGTPSGTQGGWGSTDTGRPLLPGRRDRPGSEQFGAETRLDTPPWRDRPTPTFTPAAGTAKTAPAAKTTPTGSGVAPSGIGSAGSGSGGPGAGPAGGAGVAARSSWFDRRAGEPAATAAAAAANDVKQAGTAEAPATESAKPASSSSGETTEVAGTAAAGLSISRSHDGADTGPTASAPSGAEATASDSTIASGLDADDDWPTRYSWLDDESDETPSDEAPSVEASSDETSSVEAPSDETPSDETRATTKDERAEPPTIVAALPRTTDPAEGVEHTRYASTAADTGFAKAAGASDNPASTSDSVGAPSASATPGSASGTSGAAKADTDSAPAGEADGASGAAQADAAQADDATSSEPPTVVSSAIQLVTVVPGVPRYHEANCILIRFMSDEDVQKLTIPEAKEAGCTPCAACQPEE